MLSQKCEPLQIYKETSLLLLPNIYFLLTRYSGEKPRFIYKISNSFIYIFFNSNFFQITQSGHDLSHKQYLKQCSFR